MAEERTEHDQYYSLTPPPPPQARLAPEPTEEALNDRIRRLEAALAAMQDTKLMEDRLLERVIHRIDQAPSNGTGQGPADDKAAEAMIAAGSRLIPSAMRVLGSQIGAATSPTAPPSTGLLSAQTWLLTDLLQEIRTFFVMFVDHRYRTSWPAKLVPPVAFAIFVLSWIFMHGSVIFIGSLLDYTLDFFLAILVYKTLQREAARYRAAVAGLPPRQNF